MIRPVLLMLLAGVPLAAADSTSPPVWSVIPFVALLTCIAVLPLVAAKFWHHRYPFISYGLGGAVALLYMATGRWTPLIHVFFEYLSFVAVIGCLFLVSAGIVVRFGFTGTPRANTALLLFGAVLANLIGTTGASMLLIRPFLRINRGRLRPYHLVFFIFLVANIGGALTPIGDPPLMLGYLRGIDFTRFFELNLPEWLTALAMMATIFYLIDRRNGARAAAPDQDARLAITGARNIALLVVGVACILLDPNRVAWCPGLAHGPDGWGLRLGPPVAGGETFSFVREALLLGIGCWAIRSTPPADLRANGFTSEPLREVAILFVGIFLTMLPALELIRVQATAGSLFGITLTPLTYYLGTGVFSAVLDNAPTFVAFLAGLEGQHGMTVAQLGASREPAIASALGACAIASVFWGALTYIGNGPNFMVKAIAEGSVGADGKPLMRVPTFFGYILRYSLPILLPVLLLIGALFYR